MIAGCQVLPPNNWKFPYVIVHYSGTYNLATINRPAPHGNWKPTPEKSASGIVRDLLGTFGENEKTPGKPDKGTVMDYLF